MIGKRLQEHIGTADVSMDDGVRLHEMKVVESSSYICETECQKAVEGIEGALSARCWCRLVGMSSI